MCELNNCIIDITDYNVNFVEVDALTRLLNNSNIFVQDLNWFGGVWLLCDYLKAEQILDKVASSIMSKNLSQYEKYVLAYKFAADREYKQAPKGRAFQVGRSYVDVLTGKYCTGVGLAVILKRLCDKLDIECAVQGCLVKDKYGKAFNHANVLVMLNDDKYDIHGIYYSDPRMDCNDFADVKHYKNICKLNMLAMPITEIGKIMIKVCDCDAIVEMKDLQSLYYSRNLSEPDKQYLSKFFSQTTIDNVMDLKYCQPISIKKTKSALLEIGFDTEQINKILENIKRRKSMLITDCTINKMTSEQDNRLNFVNYLIGYLNHLGRAEEIKSLDCATFVNYVFKTYFDIDLLSDGFGKSWTGKILTSSIGKNKLIDENKSLQEKICFIDTKCQIGDILFFHRQSKSANGTSVDNWYPGHCGIYLGDHKYVDSRLTTRGYAAVVDIEDDYYMQNFIGAKDVISELTNEIKLHDEILDHKI